jgi:hypothetical protein
VNGHQLNRTRIGTAVLTVAMFAAPFLALLYGLAAALAVMAAGLVATSFLLRTAVAGTSLAERGWFHAALIVNLVLAFACLILSIWLAIGD